MKKVLILAIAFALAACSSDMYGSMYEGIKSRVDSMRTPMEREVSPTPSYDTYKKEREEKK